MMREVRVSDITLFLATKEAEQLVDQLIEDGLLSEMLSGLLMERANGIQAVEFTKMTQTMEAMQETIRTLQQTVQLLATGGGVPVTSAPVVHKPVTVEPVIVPEVKKIEIDPKKLKGSGGSLMERMRKTRG